MWDGLRCGQRYAPPDLNRVRGIDDIFLHAAAKRRAGAVALIGKILIPGVAVRIKATARNSASVTE